MKLKFQTAIAILSSMIFCMTRYKLKLEIDYSVFASIMVFILLPDVVHSNSTISKMLPFLHSGVSKICRYGYLQYTLIDDYIIHYLIPVLILMAYFLTNVYTLLCGTIACFIHVIFDMFRLNEFEYKVTSKIVWIINGILILFIIVNNIGGYLWLR